MARGRMLSTIHAPVLIVGPSTDSNKEAGVEPQCKVGAGAQEGPTLHGHISMDRACCLGL